MPSWPHTGSPSGALRCAILVGMLAWGTPGARCQEIPVTAPVGVTSIEVVDDGDSTNLLVADRGRLRLFERQKESFVDVGPQRFPELSGVTQAFPARFDANVPALIAITAQRIAVLELGADGVYVDRSAERLPQPPLRGVTWLSAADLDADGDLDLIAAADDRPVLLMNDGENRLIDRSAEFLPPEPAPCRRIFPYDVGADGDVDLVTADPEVRVLIRDLYGRYRDETAKRLAGEAVRARTLVALDADDDRDIDAVLMSADLPDALWLDDGRGRLVPAAEGYLPEARSTAGIRFDVDGDGTLDLVTVGKEGVRFRLVAGRRLIEDGARFLATATPRDLTEVRAADVDGDGDLDLLLGGPNGITPLIRDEHGIFAADTKTWFAER
jgi:hypothetical protein